MAIPLPERCGNPSFSPDFQGITGPRRLARAVLMNKAGYHQARQPGAPVRVDRTHQTKGRTTR